jgi:protein tyrosine/serine phosphatase
MIKPIKVEDGIYRGAQPTTIDDWTALKDLGIKYTLDLETGARLLGDGSPLCEALRADEYGIRCYSHPLGEILPPSHDELEWACGFMIAHRPVYVHCKAGVDRTGMVIAYWRMHGSSDPARNWPRRPAIDEIFKRGMHLWYAFWWPLFL